MDTDNADKSFEFDLPGAFTGESVRCLTLVKVTSLKVDTISVKQSPPDELLALKKNVDEAAREVSLLDGRKAALTRALEMLSTPSGASGDGNENAPYSGTLADYLEYVANSRKMQTDIYAELVDVGMSLLKAQEVLNERREEYEILRSEIERKKPQTPGAVIKVRGTVSSPTRLLFEARTPAAGWDVGYEMEMDSASGDIAAKMSAVVWQKTGVNVSGTLSFHTRQPSSSVSPPEILPLTVAIRALQSDKKLSFATFSDLPLPGYSIAGAPAAMAPMDSEYIEALAPPASISTISNVTVQGKGEVDGDGNQTRINLGEFPIKSVPVIISIPERNREAWIVASVDEVPPSLLPGTAELSVDGASTGRTVIPGAAGQIRVPFGMTSRITAKKEPFVSASGSSWTGKGVRSDGYTLEVTSGMTAESEITVLDRIPIPTIDKVVLEVKKIDPEPSERDRENRLVWRLNIKPGETKKITVEYTLRYPGDETLEYGN
jgi:hypothetical protein